MLKRFAVLVLLFATCCLYGEESLSKWDVAIDEISVRAEKNDVDYLMGKVAARAQERLKKKYGSDWKGLFIREELSNLNYYCGWMTKRAFIKDGDTIICTGQHGCFIRLLVKADIWFICDFGQKLSSM